MDCNKIFKSQRGLSIKERTNDLLQYSPQNIKELAECEDFKYMIDISSIKIRIGVKKLKQIAQHFSKDTIPAQEARNLLLCGLNLVYLFSVQLTIKNDARGKASRKRYMRAKNAFNLLAKILLPDMTTEVVETSVKFILDNNLWCQEIFISDVFVTLLQANASSEDLFKNILESTNKAVSTDIITAKHLLRIFSGILFNGDWYKKSTEQPLKYLIRLRDMFRLSLGESENYSQLRDSLRFCLRRVCLYLDNDDLLSFIGTLMTWSFISNLSDEDTLEFANVVVYAATLHKTVHYDELLKNNIFLNTLKIISSQHRLQSLLGLRLLQCLLDRNGNKELFNGPTLYFEYSKLEVTIAKYDSRDSAFINTYRKIMHQSIIRALILHGSNQINLSELFTCIILVSIEVPCGMTAAWTAWVAITFQEQGLKDMFSLPCRHRIHALVIAMLSLVCWVHKSEALYKYIYQIIMKRAYQAPHLNPPLRTYYNYGQNHTTWDKPDLFFEDWELRYGLWKTFNIANK